MKKKLLALVLAAGMVASMAACGNTNSSGSASAGNSKDTSATAESTDSDLAYVKDKGTLVVGIRMKTETGLDLMLTLHLLLPKVLA